MIINRLCTYDADLKYELDELIETFTRNNDRIWACRGILDRVSIYMNIITYQKLCREIGYMPKEIARYKSFCIRIDNDLKNGQFMMKEDEIMKINYENAINFTSYLKEVDDAIGEYGGRSNGKTFRTLNPVPVKYIINKGATILFWGDGEKTIVKRSKDDKFDKEKAFLWAYFLKHCGMSRSKANKYLRDLEVEDSGTSNKK